jgi:hypothetical protein
MRPCCMSMVIAANGDRAMTAACETPANPIQEEWMGAPEVNFCLSEGGGKRRFPAAG